MIKLIVAVDSNYGIGYKNSLLFRIKEDLQRFRELTTGHFVIMGRKTFESLPNPLPERTNVVITRNPKYNPKDLSVIVVSDISRIVSHHLDTGQQEKDLWIIGGETIYKQFLPYADEIHLTVIHKKADNVDTYFPIEEALKSFYMDSFKESQSEKESCNLTFKIYKRRD